MTLTYSDENLPELGSLDPLALTLFLKRLRKWYHQTYGKTLRYFAVGEYGDESQRPHYHLAVFNFPNCVRGRTINRRSKSCCQHCDAVSNLWGKGRIELAGLEPASASYIAGYVTKKLTKKDDARLEGRHPEFARMSNRPGIGAGVMDDIASGMMELELEIDDVPETVNIGKKKYPLGRYLRRNLRKKLGRDEKTPEEIQFEIQEKLQPLRKIAEANAPRGHKNFYLKNLIIDAHEGKRVRLEARHHRLKKRNFL